MMPLIRGRSDGEKKKDRRDAETEKMMLMFALKQTIERVKGWAIYFFGICERARKDR